MYPVAQGHDYIIPTEQSRIHMEPWLHQLSKYGIGLDMLTNAAVTSINSDGINHCGELISYVTEAIQAEFEMSLEGAGSLEALHALQASADSVVGIVTDAVDTLIRDIRPYTTEIEKIEAGRGTDVNRMKWDVQRVENKDIILTIIPGARNASDGPV